MQFNAGVITARAEQMGVPAEHVGVIRTYLPQILGELTRDEQLSFTGLSISTEGDSALTNNDLIPALTETE